MIPSGQIKTDWESASSGWVPARTWAWKNWESLSRQWRKEEPPTETEGQLENYRIEWDLYGFEWKWEWKETGLPLPSASLYYQDICFHQSAKWVKYQRHRHALETAFRLIWDHIYAFVKMNSVQGFVIYTTEVYLELYLTEYLVNTCVWMEGCIYWSIMSRVWPCIGIWALQALEWVMEVTEKLFLSAKLKRYEKYQTFSLEKPTFAYDVHLDHWRFSEC